MDKPAIEIRDLVKSFPQTGSRERLIAVDHLSMTINRGEVVAFLGPNGAGKSTTVDMLLGMTRPDSGRSVSWAPIREQPHVLVASAPSFKPAGCYPTSPSQRP